MSCLGGRRISEYPPPKSAEGGATIVESCGDKREPIPKTDATGESHVSKNETWGTPCLAVAIEIKITPGPPDLQQSQMVGILGLQSAYDELELSEAA